MALLRLEAKTDDATTLTDHQCDILWSQSLCGEDDVALVFTIFIIYEQDATAISESLDGGLDASLYGWGICFSLSHFLVTLRLYNKKYEDLWYTKVDASGP